MKTWLVGALVAFLLSGIPARVAMSDDTSEEAKLRSFFQEYLDASFRAEPTLATRLGDHRFDDQLDDLSEAARAANLERKRKALAELPKRVQYDRLSRTAQIDFEILRHDLTREIWLEEQFHPFVDDPRIYGDYLTESVYLLLTQSSLPRAENVAHAVARMAKIPRVVEIARQTIGKPPRVKTETALRQTRGAIEFYTETIFTLAGEPPGKGTLAERASAIVKALQNHAEFLEKDVLPRSNDDWRIGRERFERKFALELDAGLSADEVVREAEAEATRVEREMYVIARQLWGNVCPREPLPPDDEAGRRQTIRRVLREVAKDHSSPESLVNDARNTVQEIKTFITDRKILRLPDPDRCQVIEMPEFMRGNSVAYLNSAPPLDPKASSIYAISPPPADWNADRVTSYLEEYNRAMLKILTIHEAYPGHYVQLEYSNREPSLIRRVLSSGTFAEGWAVYTEPVMLDQGFGGGDLALRLNQLKFYLRSVVNAIVDSHMHTGSMTDDEAMDLLMNHAFQTEGEAVGKIIRAKQTSCQLSTYFVGRLAFTRLRHDIQRELGDRFELGPYHEAVLSHGTVPVKYLPELVRGSLKLK